jgi:hypothetical protein
MLFFFPGDYGTGVQKRNRKDADPHRRSGIEIENCCVHIDWKNFLLHYSLLYGTLEEKHVPFFVIRRGLLI